MRNRAVHPGFGEMAGRGGPALVESLAQEHSEVERHHVLHLPASLHVGQDREMVEKRKM